jgi:hypothetical protein
LIIAAADIASGLASSEHDGELVSGFNHQTQLGNENH